MGELVVVTFNARTLAYKDANSTGHNSNTILHSSALLPNVPWFVSKKLDARTRVSSPQEGYIVVWSGTRAGLKEKKGVHGVGPTIKQPIVDGMEERCMNVKRISARWMKVRLGFAGSNGVPFT